MLRAVLVICLLSPAGLLAQPQCELTQDAVEMLPTVDRGLSEFLSIEPTLDCQGTPGETFSPQVNIFTNATITNPFLTEGGDATNALLIAGDLQPGQEVLGENVFPLRRSPVNDAELFATVRFTMPTDGSPVQLRFANLRVDTSEAPEGALVGVLVFVDGIPVGDPVDVARASGRDPAGLDILNQQELSRPGYAGGVSIRETRPGSLRPLTGLGDVLQNDLSRSFFWAYGQSGFIPADANGEPDVRFAADSGNRVQITFEGLPEGVEPFTHPVFSDPQVRSAIQFALVRDANEQMLGGTSLASLAPETRVLAEPYPYDPEAAHQMLLEAGWVEGREGEPAADASTYVVPFGWSCPEDRAGLEPTEVIVSARLAPWPANAAPQLTEEKQGGFGGSIPLPGPAYDPNVGPVEGITFDPADCAPEQPSPPMLSEGGAVNGASFEGPASPGSILSLFGTGLGPNEPQSADSIPLPDELGGVEIEINGVRVPLLFVSPNQVNFQVPQEVDPSGRLTAEGVSQAATATVVVRRGGVESDPVEIPLAAANPGVFTLDGGLGRAVAINPDSSLAQPIDSFPGLVTRPVAVGEALVILATGLGATTPPGVTGDDSLDDAGAFVRRDTVLTPRVLIGGVEAQLLFSGLSPQFVGVYQLNVIPAAGTPVGDAQSLVIEMDGVSSRADVTIAVAAP